MMTKSTFSFLARIAPRILVAAMALSAHAQTWRSDLYPTGWTAPGAGENFSSDRFLQDFSYAGYARGDREIFRRTGPIIRVNDFGADPTGVSDSTDAIQQAINEAQSRASGGVVKFGNGTYKVSLPAGRSEVIRVSGERVVLRGNGPGKTKILNTTDNMRQKAMIRFRAPGAITNGPSTPLTRDHLGPTRRLFVENAGTFSRGDLINIRWDFTNGWVSEHGQRRWWGFGKFRPEPAIYQRIITRVDAGGEWVDINVPTRYFLKTRDNARIEKISNRLSECGIEDIALGEEQVPGNGFGQMDFEDSTKSAYRCHRAVLVEFQRTRNCWMTNVRSYAPPSNSSRAHMRSNGVRLVRAFYTSLINCRFERPQYGGAGGSGYMYTVSHSNDNLFRGCTANFSRHGFSLSGAGTSGNVFLQCTDSNTARATGRNGRYVTDGEGSDTHAHFTHANLFDRCTVRNSRFESFHRGGTSSAGALTGSSNTFWNTTGAGRFSDIIVSDQGRYGFIIGTGGSSNGVRTSQGQGTRSVFPTDHVEGRGRGSELRPRSLFLDQKRRR